ncbi:MAG: transcriptional repressor [Spirochaetia bacterium]|jgi:Fe2+ or Zn2+ uptake regulation protein|nr:transcriptional repressor [Spirochaetia bacterium]
MIERRQTIQRDLVYKAVMVLHNHPTAQEVFNHVKVAHPRIGMATVYRNLNLLVEEGRLLKIPVEGGPDRFDATVFEHCHMMCRICKRVVDIDFKPDQIALAKACNATGFRHIDPNLVVSGICPDCYEKTQDKG